ncbi:MAG TPA: hypothetical protein VKB78_08955, partial [Pirellulales bacterium]|nr:hypothetical protein [Pirellulales bacterium]
HLSAACAEPAVIAIAAIAAPTKSVACFIDELPSEFLPNRNAGCPGCRACRRNFRKNSAPAQSDTAGNRSF